MPQITYRGLDTQGIPLIDPSHDTFAERLKSIRENSWAPVPDVHDQPAAILVAVLYPWGSSWYAATMTPYLWSLLQFNPDITYVSALPLMVKLHIVNAFIVVGLFPFTRLVHILVVPNPYLWRRTQVVRWYGEARRAG